MDELEQSVQRGNEARQILVNPIFKDAQEKLRQRYLTEIVSSRESEAIKRESAYLKLRVLDEVISELGIIEQDGLKADRDIKVRRRRNSQ